MNVMSHPQSSEHVALPVVEARFAGNLKATLPSIDASPARPSLAVGADQLKACHVRLVIIR